jgi:hypothetical protein
MTNETAVNTVPATVGNIVEGALKLATAQAQPVAPQPSVDNDGNRIPYPRFQEVVGQKNALAEENARLKSVLGQVSNTLNPQETLPQFETAEQLAKYIEDKTNRNVEQKLNEAYERFIAPIQQKEMLSVYGNGVEKYFASDPQAAEIRADMDAFTATLPDWKKQALIQGVMNNDYDMLNSIKSRILESKAKNIQGQVSQSLHAQVPMAQAPQPFRTVASIPASKETLIANAKATKDWSGVFNSLGPIPVQ